MRAPDTVMVIDAGEVGMRGIGGHGHDDVLSFDLWAAGAPLLVDSGTVYVFGGCRPAPGCCAAPRLTTRCASTARTAADSAPAAGCG